MRGVLNDGLRWLIGFGLTGLGLVLEIVHRIKIRTFSWNQKRLRQDYGINADTPILAYGSELEQHIGAAAVRSGGDAGFALTSGSTASPKRILYTKRRLRSVGLTYLGVFARCYWALPIRRKSLYLFSALGKDDSLTSMLLNESGLPSYLATLQAPYRVQGHAALQDLASRYGATAVRLWILAIANPGVLYSTNPSTLSTFLDELATDWQRSARLVVDYCKCPQEFQPLVHTLARRLSSRGSVGRLARIATSTAPLPLQVCAPAVEAYVCWTGGYVKPFLKRLASYLPAARYRLIPMYSMATETIETVSHFGAAATAFLPLASRVLYEFVEEGAADRPENLLKAEELQVGKAYALVVSDPYGLRRYQTSDVFLCRGFVEGLPDLHFLRRRGFEYSFSGEKLTSEHVSLVFQKLRQEFSWLGADAFLTCVPSQPLDEAIPHYKLILVGSACAAAERAGDEVARRCDALLGAVNREYEDKRDSRRLEAMRFMRLSLVDFVDRVGGARHRNTWEAQFKFLPFYRRTWESFGATE
jgi:hypothetical protein